MVFSASYRIDIIKYVIYGIASAFFVYGILLMVEGFFTSGAIKDLYGDFKITTCGRCVSAWVGLKLLLLLSKLLSTCSVVVYAMFCDDTNYYSISSIVNCIVIVVVITLWPLVISVG